MGTCTSLPFAYCSGWLFFLKRFKDTSFFFFFHQNHNTVKWKAKGFPIRIKLITFSYQRRIQSQRYYAKADPFRRLQQTLSWRQHRRHFGVKGKGSRGEAAAGGGGGVTTVSPRSAGSGHRARRFGSPHKGAGAAGQSDTHQAGEGGPGSPGLEMGGVVR